MENIKKINFENKVNKYSENLEYQLAGRYVKNFLEARTEGRRLHSWDHALFVAHHALKTLDAYHEKEKSMPNENESFSLYIASLLHDVIQPDDIRNEDLRKKMKEEWNLDLAGGEYSEGVKVFNYVVSDLEEKLSSGRQISDNQKNLIKKLAENKEEILNIYSQKENENLKELPWFERTIASRSLSIADLHGNWNPDMVVKWGELMGSENIKKVAEEKIKMDDAANNLVVKVLKEGVSKPTQEAKPKVHFTYNFFHDPEIVKDWKEVLPETMDDYEGFIKYIKILKDEEYLLESRQDLKNICIENGIGVLGMFSFCYEAATKEPRATSQEIFEKYVNFISGCDDVVSIAKKKNLSEDEVIILQKLKVSSNELKNDIKKWQERLTESEDSLGQKI